MTQQQPNQPEHVPIILHLGAHKTATTFIQRALRDAAGALEKEGTAILTPTELRKPRGPNEKKMSAAKKHAALRRHLTDIVLAAISRPDLSRLVVSEEGLIGSPATNLKRRDLYGDMAERLTALPEVFHGSNVTVMFAVRNYAPFHSSGFTTALRRGRRVATDGLAQALVDAPRGWADVLRDLRAELPKARLLIWRYEDFASLKPHVFTKMVGRDLEGPRDRVFRTLSQSATEALHGALSVPLSSDDMKRTIRELSKKHPITETNPAFSLFEADQSAAMQARYARDWEDVQRLFPDAVLTP